MNRVGIELAASMIVILIVSILMLGMAGGITYRLFCASGDKIDQIDAATQAQLERKLDSGAAVQIPDSGKSAKSSAGFCGRSSVSGAVFSIGIRNDFQADTTFTVECVEDKLQLVGGALGESSLCDEMQGEGDVDVAATQKETELLVVNVPPGTPSGKHVLTVQVLAAGELYGAANIYLMVE